MNTSNPLRLAIDAVGLTVLARELGVTHQAVRKWEAQGRMPRTEWTGETGYWQCIERLTENRVTRAMLLAPWPEANVAGAGLPGFDLHAAPAAVGNAT